MSKAYSSTKATLIDEVHNGCKATVIAAEGFVQNRNGLADTVKANSEAIKVLTASHHNLEEQVKAMARILDNSNLPKMADMIALKQEEHERQLMFMINEKQKEITNAVDKEIETVVSAKKGIWARIADTEQQILSTVASQLEEARVVREGNKDNIEKLFAEMAKFSGIAEDNRKHIKMMEYKFNEVKRDFKDFEGSMEREIKLKDNEVNHKVHVALESAKETILEESKNLAKMINKREYTLVEEVHAVEEAMERETANRTDETKIMNSNLNETMAKFKQENDKKYSTLETSMEHKVRSFAASIQEAMRIIEDEATHRDLADKELARKLVKEQTDRHHDEEKLVTLISTIQAAVSKMNTA